VKALDTLIDSQPTSGYDESLKRIWGATGAYSGMGEAFTSPSDAYILTSVTFKLGKTASPNGYLYAELYEVTGNVGSTAVPTGNALAVSTELSISSLSLSLQDINLEFNASQQYTMSSSHAYAISLHIKSGNVNGVNYVNVGANNSDCHPGNIVRYNSVSWGAMTASDLFFKIYGVLAEKLTASNEGYSGNENGINSYFSSYWVRSGSINCSGYIFSINYGSGFSNNSWVAFNATNNVWGNTTQTLLGSSSQIGNTVYFKTYANASNGKWYESTTLSFTLQATVTFQFNDYGTIEKNDISISNSSITYTTPATLKLDALPKTTRTYLNWNWTNSGGSSTDNSFSFTVTNQTTLSCWFGVSSTAQEFSFAGNATVYDVKTGATFYSSNGTLLTGIVTPFNFEGNATENKVLQYYSFYGSDGTLRIGAFTIPTPDPEAYVAVEDSYIYMILAGAVASIIVFLLMGVIMSRKRRN
jgi:hypothetical protein